MKKLFFSILLIFSALVLFAGDGFDFWFKTNVGYSFLLNDNNQYYRNHNDVSDGLFIDDFNLIAKSKKKKAFFDEISVKFRSGDRFDTGRLFSLTLKKEKKWKFNLKQVQNFDWFNDPYFNYGISGRRLLKTRFRADFTFYFVKNFIISIGYKNSKTSGNFKTPISGWLDSFGLPYYKDQNLENFYVKLKYFKKSFSFGFEQDFSSLDRKDRILPQISYNLGFADQPISLKAEQYGKVNVDIPTTLVYGNYNGDRFSVSLNASYTDGSIDNNLSNTKSYTFEDYASRNDFIAVYSGSSDAPMKSARMTLFYRFSDRFTVNYYSFWRNLKTDTDLQKDLTWLIFGANSDPIGQFTQTENDTNYYKHDLFSNTVSFDWYASGKLKFTIGYTNISDNYYIGESRDSVEKTDTSLDRVFAGFKYRKRSFSVNLTVFKENVDNPLIRVAGDDNKGIVLRSNWQLNEKIGLNFDAKYTKKENDDPLIMLDDKFFNGNIGISFLPSANSNIVFGLSYNEIDFSNLLFIGGNEIKVDEPGIYKVEQYGYFLNGNIAFKRFFINARLYYLDDNGKSYPLSYFSSLLTFQWRLTRHLSAIMDLRYYDYSEDLFKERNYNVNQIALGFRWISR